MALLGHVSAKLSLRYGRLFDTTVRAEYERALDLAKARIGPLPTQRISVTDDGNWRDAPLIKTRLAAGYGLRAPAQGSCSYANICEYCPTFHVDASTAAVFSAQRVDAEALVTDADVRGWSNEADRHRRLISRLDTLIAEQAAGGPRRISWPASSKLAQHCTETRSPSLSSASQCSRASVARASIVIRPYAPSLMSIAPHALIPAPSPGSREKLITFAPPSKFSLTASVATRNNFVNSKAFPARDAKPTEGAGWAVAGEASTTISRLKHCQPVLRDEFQDPEVLSNVPRKLRVTRRRPGLLRRVFHLLQPRTPTLGHWTAHPRVGPLRHPRGDSRAAPSHVERHLRDQPHPLSSTRAHRPVDHRTGVDQSTGIGSGR